MSLEFDNDLPSNGAGRVTGVDLADYRRSLNPAPRALSHAVVG
jgi:hypothetical protein